MKIHGFHAVALFLLLSGVCVAAESGPIPPREPSFVEMVAARDGALLWTQVFLPHVEPDARFPVIVARTPYLNEGSGEMLEYRSVFYTRRGYVWVIQASRGTYLSQGEFVPYRDEISDGSDLVDWVAAQDWANPEHLGAAGCSYAGYTALATAIGNPLITAVWADGPVESGAFVFHGGLFSYDTLSWLNLFVNFSWFDEQQHAVATNSLDPASLDSQLLGEEYPYWQALIAAPHPENPIFETHGIKTRWPDLMAPTLFTTAREMTTQAVRRGLMESSHPATRDLHRYLIVEGNHCDPSRAWGEETSNPEQEAIDAFLEQHLLGQAGEPLPKIQYRTSADTALRAISDLGDTEELVLYLDATGPGDGRLSPVAPTQDGQTALEVDPLNQDPCQEQHELRFVSAPLQQAMLLLGEPRIELWASSSQVDADFFALLGYNEEDYIAHGGVRARYRNGFEAAEDLVPNRPTEFLIATLREPAMYIPAGSPIYLSISGHFCGYVENPHTGEQVTAQTERRVSLHRVYSGPSHPSRVIIRRVLGTSPRRTTGRLVEDPAAIQ